MIKTIIKVTGLLILLVLVLSIDISGKPLFSYIYKTISPTTKLVQKKAAVILDDSIQSTKTYTQQIFDNSVPKFKDSVKSKLSSIKKKTPNEPAENITEDEKEELNDLIKNH
jgi:Pyruvate/2-oxoacid:ferredoxin oxidoreductase gamma subunit